MFAGFEVERGPSMVPISAAAAYGVSVEAVSLEYPQPGIPLPASTFVRAANITDDVRSGHMPWWSSLLYTAAVYEAVRVTETAQRPVIRGIWGSAIETKYGVLTRENWEDVSFGERDVVGPACRGTS
jgi:hypothetical protein